jgi:hypothetical protein
LIYPAESSEAFCEGHNVSFEFFGGVPRSILYDNIKLAVARILGDGRRLRTLRTRVFSELLASLILWSAKTPDFSTYWVPLCAALIGGVRLPDTVQVVKHH